MKRFKPTAWLATLAIALVALLGAASPAAAVQIKSDDTVTVEIAGLEEGVEAETYQIFTVNWNDDINAPNDPIYQWSKSMVSWLESNGYKDYIDGDDGVDEKYGTPDTEFFDKLVAAVKGGKVELTKVDTVTSTANGLAMTEKMGGYLTIINNSANRVYQPIAFNVYPEYSVKDSAWTLTSNHKDATEGVKWRPITIKKTVENKVIDGKQYGDVLNFDVTVDVPQYPANATPASKKFTVSDKFDAGLTYNNDVKVIGIKGDEETTLSPDLYTVGAQGIKRTDVTFAVSFKYPGIAEYDKVRLEYTGTLNKDAVIGSTGNKNQAILEWNNKPYDENGYEATDPIVTVYSYGLEVLKYAKGDESKKGLEGATFNVSLNNKNIYFTKVSDGNYKVAEKQDGTEGSLGVITNADGKLLLAGLNEGTYQLTETVPPAGYNKPAQPFTVTIKDADADGNLDGKVENEKTNGYAYFEIENTSGFQLPVTGGAGTVAITAAGVAIMAAAGISLARSRKNN